MLVRGFRRLDPQGQTQLLHYLFWLVARRGTRFLWDRALGRWWHKRRNVFSAFRHAELSMFCWRLLPPPPPPSPSTPTAAPHPPCCCNWGKHGIKSRRRGHRRGLLLGRWDGDAKRWMPGKMQGDDFGAGSTLPFVPFAYCVFMASPI